MFFAILYSKHAIIYSKPPASVLSYAFFRNDGAGASSNPLSLFTHFAIFSDLTATAAVPAVFRLQMNGSSLHHLQDMTGPPGGADPKLAGGDAHHSLAVGAGCRRLSDAVFAKAAEGKFVLTLGGDHSIAMGTLAGILRARPDTRVLWVDAHADINSPKGSPSGNMHGGRACNSILLPVLCCMYTVWLVSRLGDKEYIGNWNSISLGNLQGLFIQAARATAVGKGDLVLM